MAEVEQLQEHVKGGVRIAISHGNDATTVHLEGEWDLEGQARMRSQFQAVLEHSPETILLDLSSLEFIDSTGIHGVVELHERAAQQHARLVILPGPPTVQRIFEIVGLTDVLPFQRITEE